MVSTAASTIPARLWRRLAALCYDLLIALALIMVVGLATQITLGGELVADAARVHVPAWYPLLQCAVVALYFMLSWRYGGQTLGMRPWQLYLRGSAGRPAGWPAVSVRALVMCAPLAALALHDAIGVERALALAATLWIGCYVPCLLPGRPALQGIVSATRLWQRRTPRQPKRRK